MFYILSLCFMNASLLSSVFRSRLAPHLDPTFMLNHVPAFSSFPLTYFFCHLRPEVLFKSGLVSVMNSLSCSFVVDKYIGIHSRIIPEWFFIHAANVVTRIWKHKELKTCVCNVSQAACSFKVGENEKKKQALLFSRCAGSEC